VQLAWSFAASATSVVACRESAGGAAAVSKKQLESGGEFKRLRGVLCDPCPNIFFRRLQNPLDFLAVCSGCCSAISMKGGDKELTTCDIEMTTVTGVAVGRDDTQESLG